MSTATDKKDKKQKQRPGSMTKTKSLFGMGGAASSTEPEELASLRGQVEELTPLRQQLEEQSTKNIQLSGQIAQLALKVSEKEAENKRLISAHSGMQAELDLAKSEHEKLLTTFLTQLCVDLEIAGTVNDITQMVAAIQAKYAKAVASAGTDPIPETSDTVQEFLLAVLAELNIAPETDADVTQKNVIIWLREKIQNSSLLAQEFKEYQDATIETAKASVEMTRNLKQRHAEQLQAQAEQLQAQAKQIALLRASVEDLTQKAAQHHQSSSAGSENSQDQQLISELRAEIEKYKKNVAIPSAESKGRAATLQASDAQLQSLTVQLKEVQDQLATAQQTAQLQARSHLPSAFFQSFQQRHAKAIAAIDNLKSRLSENSNTSPTANDNALLAIISCLEDGLQATDPQAYFDEKKQVLSNNLYALQGIKSLANTALNAILTVLACVSVVGITALSLMGSLQHNQERLGSWRALGGMWGGRQKAQVDIHEVTQALGVKGFGG